jgi:hypothetical protein
MTIRFVHYRFDEENCWWCGKYALLMHVAGIGFLLRGRVPLFATLLYCSYYNTTQAG